MAYNCGTGGLQNIFISCYAVLLYMYMEYCPYVHHHDRDCIVDEIKSICQNINVMLLKVALSIRNGNHDSLYIIRWPTNCRVTTVKGIQAVRIDFF
jgi:hypothetical protein